MTPPQAALAPRVSKGAKKSRRKTGNDRKRARTATSPSPEAGKPPQPILAQVRALIHKGQYKQAIAMLEAPLKQRPDDGEAWTLLGAAHEFNGSTDLAYHCYKRAIDLTPQNADAWLYFGRLLCEKEHPQASAVAIERSLALRPDCAEALKILALDRLNLADAKGGLEACDRALSLDPGWTVGYYVKGILHKSVGDMEDARKALLKGNDQDPRLIDILHGLVDISKGEQLQDVLSRLDRIDPETIGDLKERSDYYFVAGRAHRALERHEEAFELYRQGNDLVKELYPFDKAAHKANVDELISVFDSDLFARVKATGSDSQAPVFVVGMPRSGSTLTERIIAAHSRAQGVGESTAMLQIVSELSNAKGCALSYPRDVGKMEAQAFALLAGQYLASVGSECPDRVARVVDKMLFNYLNLGLIALLVPNARVIHCRRDPMDTCMSCYFVRFGRAKNLSFTSDLEALGFYYREYDRLMAHWREVLPLPIHEVRYEDLISDQESESRRLIEFVGLDWEDACLEFHREGSGVRTASAVQVRQPIYKTSAGRWKLYEKQLAPLRQALGGLVRD